jgi:copper chaperone CopZ
MKFQILFFTCFSFLLSSLALSSQKTCFRVEGMVCGKCVAKVENQFSKQSSVKNTRVSLKQERVDFESEKPLNKKEMIEQFNKIGLKAESIACD